MNLDGAIAELRKRNEPVPKPARLPSEAEIRSVERQLEVLFHPDYRRFLLEASDVVYGVIELATIDSPSSHSHLPKVVASARDYGVPADLLPFCEDNEDFYCLSPNGEVHYWSHNGWASEKWRDLAHWIQDVWLEAHA